jgi:hypothetical protein
MLTKAEIEQALSKFRGSEQWHQWSSLSCNFLLTDGAKFIAEECDAYWLMDLIASYHAEPDVRKEWFQVWNLEVNGSKATVTCDDSNENIIAYQEIEYTNFLLDGIKLYAINDGEQRVIMLPLEY